VLDPGELQAILSEFRTRGGLDAARQVHYSPTHGWASLEGQVAIVGRTVSLRIELDSSFPATLPKIRLLPWDVLGFIPHVDRTGAICHFEPEGLLLDRRQPVDIICEALERVKAVLEAGVLKTNLLDFVDEFGWYWERASGTLSASSVLTVPTEPQWISVSIGHDNTLWVVQGGHEIASLLNMPTIRTAISFQKALFLSMPLGTLIVPPPLGGPFWTVQESRERLLEGLDDGSRRAVHKLLKNKRSSFNEYVIVNLPRTRGGSTLFGLRYERVGSRHPLADGGEAVRVAPIRIHRLDRGYLLERSGGEMCLEKKRVLLVGCGAVGGHVAVELAKAGVSRLTLVDPDHLSADNTYRHVLGRKSSGKQKVIGLKADLEAQLPYMKVQAISSSIEQALREGAVKFADYDLVILATGNPSLELAINKHLHAQPIARPMIVTWLEPLGVGGHALLTAHGQGCGCLECLYAPLNENYGVFENRAAFAEQGQVFSKDLSGCGGTFTPYGSLDALQTAGLAVRLAIDVLTAAAIGNPLLQWKGNGERFRQAGYRLSDRFELSSEALHESRFSHVNPHCRICGHRNEHLAQSGDKQL
jgi:molybdopterin-synthase adenylyltransferase